MFGLNSCTRCWHICTSVCTYHQSSHHKVISTTFTHPDPRQPALLYIGYQRAYSDPNVILAFQSKLRSSKFKVGTWKQSIWSSESKAVTWNKHWKYNYMNKWIWNSGLDNVTRITCKQLLRRNSIEAVTGNLKQCLSNSELEAVILIEMSVLKTAT